MSRAGALMALTSERFPGRHARPGERHPVDIGVDPGTAQTIATAVHGLLDIAF